MADTILVRVTELMRNSIEELEDSEYLLAKIKHVDSGNVLEYRHVTHLFKKLQMIATLLLSSSEKYRRISNWLTTRTGRVAVIKMPKRLDPSKYKYFHEFLEGSGIYEETVEEPKKSPELLERLERLKAEIEEKKYKTMVENVTQEKRSFGEDFGAEVRTTSQQLTSVLNYVITIFGCAFFAYYASEFAWDELSMRVLFSVIIGTIVALAELYFLARTEI